MNWQDKIEWICKFTKDEFTYYIGEKSSVGYVFYVSKVIDGDEIVYIDKYTSLMDFPELLNGTIREETLSQAEGDEIAKKLTNVTEYLKRKNKEQRPCYLKYIAEDGIACAEIKNGKVTREIATNDLREELDEKEGLESFDLYSTLCSLQGASSIISKEVFIYYLPIRNSSLSYYEIKQINSEPVFISFVL